MKNDANLKRAKSVISKEVERRKKPTSVANNQHKLSVFAYDIAPILNWINQFKVWHIEIGTNQI